MRVRARGSRFQRSSCALVLTLAFSKLTRHAFPRRVDGTVIHPYKGVARWERSVPLSTSGQKQRGGELDFVVAVAGQEVR